MCLDDSVMKVTPWLVSRCARVVSAKAKPGVYTPPALGSLRIRTLYLSRPTTRNAFQPGQCRLYCNTLSGRKPVIESKHPPPGRSSFISGELKAVGGDSICLCLTGALLCPPPPPKKNATLDNKRTLSWVVSYRRLSPQFNFSVCCCSNIYLYRSVHRRERVLLRQK